MEQIDQTVRKQLNFVTCQTIEGVLEAALNRKSEPEAALFVPIPEDIRAKSRKPSIRQ